MWFESLPPDTSWSSLWFQYIRCDTCNGIRTFSDPCPVCGSTLDTKPETIRLEDGQELTVHRSYRGAETRYEDYVYLQLLEREWKRTMQELTSREKSHFLSDVSDGAAIVLIFWTYFESKIEYLLRSLLGHIPAPFLEDTLKRYSSISARLTSLYKIAFNSTYYKDLCSLDFGDVRDKLSTIHKKRNDFVHGSPMSIDDALVKTVVGMLKREHEAWVAVYNFRVASQR